MTGYELLEFAAKAYWAGDDVSTRFDEREGDGLLYIHADNQDHNGADREFVWNPLTDDGDAFRLAVKLGMRIETPKYKGYGSSANPLNYPTAGATVFSDDPNEQTRRAIVMCAAEIGKTLP
jgi:hypothetical protein